MLKKKHTAWDVLSDTFTITGCVLLALWVAYSSAIHIHNKQIIRPAKRVNNITDNFSYVNSHTYQDKELQSPSILFAHSKRKYNHSQGVITELNKINQDRLQHHLTPVKLSNALNHVAQIRAKQVFFVIGIQGRSDDTNIHEEFSGHDDDEESDLLENKYPAFARDSEGNPKESAENACSIQFGKTTYNDGKYGKIRYHHITTTNQMAGIVNNVSMYHDQAEHNGHRHNILDPRVHYVGIGIYYQPKINLTVFVEDFLE